jgi:hypothetical protein
MVGLLAALAVLSLWLIGGPNLGWTKTSVAYKEKDPVTEIEVNKYVNKFVPGVDFLAAGLFVSGVLIGFSFLFKKRANSKN